MAAKLRVHLLAKELGVSSKAVIEKCRAEGIDLKNHMAAISVGLAESIREWFSTGVDVTSVEVAEAVDVEKVRVVKRRTKRAGAPEEGDGEAAVATEVEAPPAEAEQAPAAAVESTVIQERAEAPAEVEELAPAAEAESLTPAAEAAPLQVSEEQAATGAEVAEAPAEEAVEEVERAEAGAAAAEAPRKVEPGESPKAPEPVVPAGPQVVPTPAELKGPTVVRIEAPEPTRVPRARPRTAPAARGLERAEAPPAEPSAPRRGRKGRKQVEDEAVRARSRSPRRHGGAAEVDQRLREWRDQDLLERKERLASVTGHGLRDRRAAERRRQASATGAAPSMRREPVSITAPIPIKEFCAAVGVPFVTVSKKLMEHTGRLWTINQSLDHEQVELLALDLGVKVEIEKAKTAYELLEEEFRQRERKNLQPRPPVVAMLGHVDHGKTSLLDRIRESHVVAGEAGGITQHIGAYRVRHGGWDVTFVDTPGHRAFTEMRARGAHLTDVVVLVVAADDGVMPQTVEAIAHARAAGVAIVVALNKIDLPGLDLNKVYAQLAEHGLTPSEWGGDTDVIKTSATTGEGVDDLVAHLSTLSELMELKADPDVPAQAMVIEAQMREGRGAAAQVLVREGTLRPGQFVVCGPGAGRIRALRDDRGKSLDSAGPGTPLEVFGLDELPGAGDVLYQVSSLQQAKQIAEEVRQRRREEALEVAPKPRTLEALMLGEAEGGVPELNLIIRADVQGSVDVLKQALGELPAEKARLNVLHAGVGAVSEADVHLAKASGALIIGFHVLPEDRARQLADQLGVEIRTYRVIYEVLDDLHQALAGLLAPVEQEEVRGSMEVRQVFNVSRVGTIAGCYVTDGVVHRNHRVRVVRDGRIVSEGRAIASLKRFKDDAREVRAGLECGLKIEDFDDVKPGDVIQAFELVEVAQEL